MVFIFLLPAVFLFSSCSKSTDGLSSKVTEAPEQPEFTEGIWIQKYPEDNACFKLETAGGYKIICDPHNISETLTRGVTLQPDIVTESHQDADHTDTSRLEGPYELITQPGEYKSDDVVINGYAGKHNKGDEEGTNNIYVFQLEDITIAHFASQGEVPGDELLKQIGTVDVLMIQIFDNPNYHKLTIDDMDGIVKELNPKIIIPEHGDSNAGESIAEHFNAKENFEESGSIIISRKMLDEIDKLLVVDLDTY